ncbi:hypothetical protein Rt10032_c12g4760 [Rhodotorula toruloides]|uniref:Uncharacterized protein n=1 Tax=Rhodotorula toruloides TaxID=5286 RepID=A0A511KK53_RHOTO|nr:hypothetical protein Rt10032_c12g4760 [Rhodotorula toruloides]
MNPVQDVGGGMQDSSTALNSALPVNTMPSLFLPDVGSLPPSYTAINHSHYTFEDLILQTGRVVREPYLLLRCGILFLKTSNPLLRLLRTQFDLAIETLASTGRPEGSPRSPLALESRPAGFHQAFLEVPAPGVSRPNMRAPKSLIIPASATVEDWLRTGLTDFDLRRQPAQRTIGLIQHPAIFGVAYEVWAIRFIGEHGLTVTLENGVIYIPQLPTKRLNLSPTETSSPSQFSAVEHLCPLFPFSGKTIEDGIYLPTLSNYPRCHHDVSSSHPIYAEGINGLLRALGSCAPFAHFHFLFVGLNQESGQKLISGKYPALSKLSESKMPKPSTRSTAGSAYHERRLDRPHWTLSFALLDPVPSVKPDSTYADIAKFRKPLFLQSQ